MSGNYHTHSRFCDGEDTLEEIVLSAIDIGFSSIGFSGHGYNPGSVYCMQDTEGYIKEISRLKEKYKGKIQVYCGVEEEAVSFVKRDDFDYIIGSSHYFYIDGKHYPIDSNYDCFKKCLEVFDYDVIKLAETYYSEFVSYILKRKPDIIGHFDLITKFDEMDEMRFLNNPKYLKLSEAYIKQAAKSGCLFEVNTGAISRGYRKTPYPYENLLYVLKQEGNGLVLSSDCHNLKNLNFYFEETEALLKDVGFDCVYELDEGNFKKRHI